jgi:hypothetical protein
MNHIDSPHISASFGNVVQETVLKSQRPDAHPPRLAKKRIALMPISVHYRYKIFYRNIRDSSKIHRRFIAFSSPFIIVLLMYVDQNLPRGRFRVDRRFSHCRPLNRQDGDG